MVLSDFLIAPSRLRFKDRCGDANARLPESTSPSRVSCMGVSRECAMYDYGETLKTLLSAVRWQTWLRVSVVNAWTYRPRQKAERA